MYVSQIGSSVKLNAGLESTPNKLVLQVMIVIQFSVGNVLENYMVIEKHPFAIGIIKT